MHSEFNFFAQNKEGKQLTATYTLKSMLAYIKNNGYVISGDPLINWNGGFSYILIKEGDHNE